MIVEFENLSDADLIQGAVYKGGNNKNPMQDDPLKEIFRLSGFKKGIGNQGGFRKASKEKDGKIISKSLAFVVMVDSKTQTEWPNEYDENLGVFKYYGDNRTPGNDIFNTKNLGNKFLNDIFTKSYLGPEQRSSIPPIFLFSSTGKGCDKKFIGIAVPDINGNKLEDSLKRQVFKNEDGEFENFLAQFTILDTSDEVISRQWLKNLKSMDSPIGDYAPTAWLEFILNNSKVNVTKNKAEEIEIREEYDKGYTNEVRRNIKVRVTQGKFRDDLMKRDKVCVLCGLDMNNILMASHIKPWSKSSDYEKVDSDNGLLLCSMHDALFDKGYIAFNDKGKMIISTEVSKANYSKLNIERYKYINVASKEQVEYLKYHRDNVFKR